MKFIPVETIEEKSKVPYKDGSQIALDILEADSHMVVVQYNNDEYVSVQSAAVGLRRIVKDYGVPAIVKQYRGRAYVIRTDI